VKARPDLDNLLKATLDFCVARNLIDDDRHVQQILIKRSLVTSKSEMVVTISAVKEAA
jgi:Holliday junction resolvase RusA-like endonuclease